MIAGLQEEFDELALRLGRAPPRARARWGW